MSQVNPAVDTIKSLTKASGLISLILAVLLLLSGVLTLPFGVGLLPIALAVLNYLVYANCKEIVRLVESSRYREAKEKTLVWMIVGFLFGWIVVGILLLIAYLKYDEVLRHSEPLEREAGAARPRGPAREPSPSLG